MPLRGYHRVGGPNATLTELGFGGHGTPSQQYPAYGTLLQENLIEANYITIQETSEVTGNGIRNYNTYANGLGGSYDVTNYFQYVAYGQRLGSSEWDTTPEYSLYQYDGQNWYYENGKYTVKWALSDGNGGYYAEPVLQGGFLTGQVSGGLTSGTQDSTYTFVHDGVTDYVANGKYTYNALTWEVSQFTGYPTGVIFMTDDHRYEGGSFYPDGQYYMDASDTSVEVPSGSTNYYWDGNDNRWEWNGNGEIVFRYSGLYAYGTFITNYQDYNYYWDGSGGYYQGEYTGSGNQYASAGSTTGNTSSGTNTIYINGFDVNNGSYNSTEYNDGQGGTYWETSYNYEPYGTQLYNDGMTIWFSSGDGNYYTQPVNNNPSYGTPTGNTSGGTSYVDINGNNYACGSYTSTEYHDGNGGTYWDNSYSYYPYGDLIASINVGQDEWGNDMFTNYYSDGSGSYYIS